MEKRAKIRRNAQAALEFLMTYGWIITTVLVAIGALAYFGVLSPDKFLPRKCIVETGIGCMDFKVQEDSVTLVLRNGKGEDITISQIAVKDCIGTNLGLLKNGEQAAYTVGGCTNNPNAKFSGDINITYTSDSGISKKKAGSISDRVESGCGLCACANTNTSCGAYPACNNCNLQDGYSTNYCSASNVFRDFNDYSCASQACNPTATPELVPPSCTASNGICQSAPSVQCVCADTASSCGTFPACSNCAPNNGICSSGACSCSNTASSCGTYPNCLSCGANKMCYTASCLWNLSGVWGANFIYGYKRTNFIQNGNNVHDSLIDSMPGFPVGSETINIVITGDTFSGIAHSTIGDKVYSGTIENSGTKLNGVIDPGGFNVDFDYNKE